MGLGPVFYEKDAASPVITAWERTSLEVLPLPIPADSPNDSYMVERGVTAEKIFDAFVLHINEDPDLRRGSSPTPLTRSAQRPTVVTH